jgi:hypothetical protein
VGAQVTNVSTEVIILAQGTQSRLGHAHGLKQLLPLPACGGMSIMGRTAIQCRSFVTRDDIVMVTWPEVAMGLRASSHPWSWPADRVVTLPDPGNSSLKGIARYLESRAAHGDRPVDDSRTVVLMGDVVYSWACLEALFQAAGDWGFVGTPDLSASGGEIWGVGWSWDAETHMMVRLRDALLRHPPFEEDYQPGQLRRWISGWRRGDIATHTENLRRTGHYTDIADYTHDIDIPAHLTLLPWLSESASADDRQHGLDWSRR